MRLKLRSLDYEVSRLKGFEPEVGRLRALLSKNQQKLTSAEAQVVKRDHQISPLKQQVQELSILQTQQTQEILDLQAQLNASEVVVTSLEASHAILQGEKHRAETKREEVEDELKATTQLLEDVESRCGHLKKKLFYFKVKAT